MKINLEHNFINEKILVSLTKNKFTWVGTRAYDCFALSKIININSIISCDYGKDIHQFTKDLNANLFSLEKIINRREYWNNYSLENLLRRFQTVRNSINNKDPSAHLEITNILPYSSTKQLEAFANEENGDIAILSAPSQLKKKLDNKFLLKKICQSINVPSIPGDIFSLENLSFNRITKRFGCPFVLQLPIGSSGDNTFLVSNESYLRDIIKSSAYSKVMVSKYIYGLSPNINCVVAESEVILTFPSIQLIGIEEATHNLFGYCGNDFSAVLNLEDDSLIEIYSQSIKIGRWLKSNGYIGLFGIDFLCEKKTNRVYPIDINPRFQGSTDLLSQLQILNEELPLPLYHIGAFLKKNERIIKKGGNTSVVYPKALQGSQINLHNTQRDKICLNRKINPGVYSIKEGNLNFVRNGLSVFDCCNSDEFVITCGVPESNLLINPYAYIFKIQTLHSVLDAESYQLNQNYKKICTLINKKLIYKKI